MRVSIRVFIRRIFCAFSILLAMQAQLPPPADPASLLLVFIAEPGELHGVERSTGTLLFKYRFQDPLIESEANVRPRPRLVPNLDGSLLYTADNIKFYSLPDVHVKDLVAKTPISNLPGLPGVLLVGTKESRVHSLDFTTLNRDVDLDSEPLEDESTLLPLPGRLTFVNKERVFHGKCFLKKLVFGESVFKLEAFDEKTRKRLFSLSYADITGLDLSIPELPQALQEKFVAEFLDGRQKVGIEGERVSVFHSNSEEKDDEEIVNRILQFESRVHSVHTVLPTRQLLRQVTSSGTSSSDEDNNKGLGLSKFRDLWVKRKLNDTMKKSNLESTPSLTLGSPFEFGSSPDPFFESSPENEAIVSELDEVPTSVEKNSGHSSRFDVAADLFFAKSSSRRASPEMPEMLKPSFDDLDFALRFLDTPLQALPGTSPENFPNSCEDLSDQKGKYSNRFRNYFQELSPESSESRSTTVVAEKDSCNSLLPRELQEAQFTTSLLRHGSLVPGLGAFRELEESLGEKLLLANGTSESEENSNANDFSMFEKDETLDGNSALVRSKSLFEEGKTIVREMHSGAHLARHIRQRLQLPPPPDPFIWSSDAKKDVVEAEQGRAIYSSSQKPDFLKAMFYSYVEKKLGVKDSRIQEVMFLRFSDYLFDRRRAVRSFTDVALLGQDSGLDHRLRLPAPQNLNLGKINSEEDLDPTAENENPSLVVDGESLSFGDRTESESKFDRFFFGHQLSSKRPAKKPVKTDTLNSLAVSTRGFWGIVFVSALLGFLVALVLLFSRSSRGSEPLVTTPLLSSGLYFAIFSFAWLQVADLKVAFLVTILCIILSTGFGFNSKLASFWARSSRLVDQLEKSTQQTLFTSTTVAPSTTLSDGDPTSTLDENSDSFPTTSTISSASFQGFQGFAKPQVEADSILGKTLQNCLLFRQFEDVSYLGEGGFGVVYKGKNRLDGTWSAFKVKPYKLKLDEDVVRGGGGREFGEVRSFLSMRHKHLVFLHTHWCEESQYLPDKAEMKRTKAAAERPILKGLGPITTEWACEEEDEDNAEGRAGKGDLGKFQQLKQRLDNPQETAERRAFSMEKTSTGGFSPKLLEKKNYQTDVTQHAIPENEEFHEKIPEVLGKNPHAPEIDDNPNPKDSGFSVEESSSELDTLVRAKPYAMHAQVVEQFVVTEEEPEESPASSKKKQQQPSTQNILEEATSLSELQKMQDRESDSQSFLYDVCLVMSMELVEGPNLKAWLSDSRRSTQWGKFTSLYSFVESLEVEKDFGGIESPWDDFLEFDFARQLVKGVRFMHKRGFVHRDLKPQNCFLNLNSGTLKIGDFGLSSTNHETLGLGTNFSKAWGTPLYMPPEGNILQEATDIYAVGVILLQLLAPRPQSTVERLIMVEDFRSRSSRVWRNLEVVAATENAESEEGKFNSSPSSGEKESLAELSTWEYKTYYKTHREAIRRCGHWNSRKRIKCQELHNLLKKFRDQEDEFFQRGLKRSLDDV